MSDRVKEHYGNLFGLPAEQIRFFDELTGQQVEEARRLFTSTLSDAHDYVYAAQPNGGLFLRREKRQPLAALLRDDEIHEIARIAVTGVLADLMDRSGLKHEWRQIDSDIQEEIILEWRRIIREALDR